MTGPQVIRGDCVAVPVDLLARFLDRVVAHQGAMIIGDPIPATEVTLLGNECRALTRYVLHEIIILAPADWAETPDARRARRKAIETEQAAIQRQLGDDDTETTTRLRRRR